MDNFTLQSVPVRTTQGAEGLPRWKWTVAELVRLSEIGILRDADKVELIDGEIVPMAPAGPLHLSIGEKITDFWIDLAVPGVRVRSEPQFQLADTTYILPDVLVWPRSLSIVELRGPEALLAVEVADSSLTKDAGVKRRLYAAHGVREYWVVKARSLEVIVHRAPVGEDYTDVFEVAASQLLTPTFVPALALRLSDL
jgi:Uma2 family endonuclease